MGKRWRIIFTVLLFAIVLTACGDSEDETAAGENDNAEGAEETEETNAEEADESETQEDSNGNPESDEELYHEIGDTFEFEIELLSVPVEITVHDIWTEDGADHQEFLEESIGSAEDEDNVTFIHFTVTNQGEEPIYYHEILPNYYGVGSSEDEVDISYPENDEADSYLDGLNLQLDPGETKELTGAKATTIYSENGGAFVWNFIADIPEVVFHTPQSERNDPLGIYDLGEEIYVIDESEEHQLIVTINDIEVKEETEFEKTQDGIWMVLDMNIENAGTESKIADTAFPQIVTEGNEELYEYTREFKMNGEWIEDIYEGLESYIESGETVDGELFLEVDEDMADEVQFLYPDRHLLIYPEFGKKLNYNLD
jgi:hypothetical protein